MKLGILFSGGKDSNLAMYIAKKYGYEIEVLITLIPKSEGFLFHYPNIKWTTLQAKAIEIPIIQHEIEIGENKEVEGLKEALEIAKKEFNIEGIVTGAIRSTYQATRFQKVCDLLDLWCFNPLWLKDEIEILKYILKENFEVVITGVSAYPLNESYLGKKIDQNFLEEIVKLRKYLNIAGEGGEFETFVINSPLFKRKIKIKKAKKIWNPDEYRGYYLIEEAELW